MLLLNFSVSPAIGLLVICHLPEINWILMVSCLLVVIGFRDTEMIGNAYGLAVIIVMFVTTCLMFLVIVMLWKRGGILEAFTFVIVFGLLCLSSCLVGVAKGGLSSCLSGHNFGINRVRGAGLVYTNVLSEIPPMFSHFVTSFPAFHHVLIIVTFQYLTIPRVFCQSAIYCKPDWSPLSSVSTCALSGCEGRKDSHAFETNLIETLAEF
ncbi:hypothetical protein Peur_003660 [Populus x canadensis]